MKKRYNIIGILLMAVGFLTSCSEDSLDSLEGKYDMDRYVFKEVKQEPTVKLKKGIKDLVVKLVSAEHDTLQVDFGSSEWILQDGTYNITQTLVDNKEYAAAWIMTKEHSTHNQGVSDTIKVIDGALDVQLVGDVYYLNSLMKDETGRTFKMDYKGTLSFAIGEDDPEASGYTAVINTSPVYQLDSNNQPIGIIPGVTKYSFAVSDPDGNGVAQFDLVNKENLALENLAGNYSVTGTSEPGSMDMGNALPAEWGGFAWGSYFVAGNAKQYILGGTLTITAVTGMEGETLLTFSAKELNTTLGMDATGAQIPGTANEVSYRFVTVLQNTGIELRDQQMQSTVMNRQMPYSIYLPKSYDGTKEYPVLYLLHGADSNHNDWMAQGMLNSYASAAEAAGGKEMIIVCPNGSPDGQNIFYCDNYQGNDMKYMTFFFDEFIPYIESVYKVKSKRGTRAVAGLSMGGFGSLYYGFLHPEMFCYVYACSPATYIDGAPNLYEMLGTQGLPGITIEIGSGDFLFESAGYFKQALDGSGIANEYIVRDGVHDWAFWKGCLPKLLKKVSDTFEE